MKKVLLSFLILAMTFCLCACGGTSTTSDATEDSSGLEGLWVYEGPSDQDPSYVVNFSTDEGNTYTVEVNNNITAADQASTNTATFSGTYTAEDGKLTLQVDSVDNTTGVLTNVEKDSTLDLTYELSADNDVVTINDLSNYVKDLPSSIEMQKSNQ